MLIATNDANEQITADRDLEKTQTFYCPSCRSRVHLKVGSVMRAHFAHFQREACDVFSEGETEEHLNGKEQLKEWLEHQNIPVEMEAYLPELKQRPDLLVKWKGKKVAIEFQCSSIPIEKVKERTLGYQSAGYEVVWILGEAFQYKKQLTALQKACLTSYNETPILFHYSVKRKRLEYFYNFHLQQNQKMTHTKKILRSNGSIGLQVQQKTQASTQKINIEMEHHKLLRQLQFPNDKNRRFLEKLYESRETLVSMPKEVYEIVPSEWMIQDYTHEWKIKFIQWIESKGVQSIITKKQLMKWSESLHYYEMPQLSDEQRLQPILEFMDTLTQSGVFKQIRFDKWTIINLAKRYKHLEEKFR